MKVAPLRTLHVDGCEIMCELHSPLPGETKSQFVRMHVADTCSHNSHGAFAVDFDDRHATELSKMLLGRSLDAVRLV